MKELKIKIAGIGIRIKWSESRIMRWPPPQYRDFIWRGKTEVELRVHCGELPIYPPEGEVFDCEEHWRLYQSRGRYIIESCDEFRPDAQRIALMNPDFTSGDIYVQPMTEEFYHIITPNPPRTLPWKLPRWSFPHLMQPFGKLLMVNLLTKGKGMMVHGLGIIEDGGKQGIAFIGPSGSGKSTLAKFYRREKKATILSDEVLIIRKQKGQFFLYGTPWFGDVRSVSSQGVPLKKLFFIRHGPENVISQESPGRLFSELFSLLFLPFWDKQRVEFVLGFCKELMEEIDCKKLSFVKDRSIIDFVRR